MATGQPPSSVEPARNAGHAGSAPGWSTRAGHQATRAVVLVAGLGLLVGFFLPWMRFGDFAALSGLSLMVSSGTAVDALAGPSRGLLVIIPVCGAALVASAILAPRFAALVSLVSGIAILAFGLFTLARLFFETVGPGMWVVVVSAFAAAGVGVAYLASDRDAD
jgi:hypothetical protein